ncbi:unnamed protein product, partial [Pylaiella littoralis]
VVITEVITEQPNQPARCTATCCNTDCPTVRVQESNADLNGPPIAISRCKHAAAVLGSRDTPKTDIPLAVAVAFGKDGEGVESVATTAVSKMYMGRASMNAVLRMADATDEHGLPLLMQLGDRQSYVVYHPANRSI